MGSITLEELDGTPIAGTTPPDRVKPFFVRKSASTRTFASAEIENDGDDKELEEEEETVGEQDDTESVVDGKRVMPKKDWGFCVQLP